MLFRSRGVEDVSVSSLAEKIDTELRKWATWEFARPATEVDKEPGLSAIFAKTDALPAREILIYSRDQISTIYQNREYGLGRTNVNRGYNPRLQTEVDGPIIVDWGVLDTLGGSIEPNRGYGPRVQTEARGAITVDWSVLNTLGDLPPISSDIRPPAPPLLENRVR